MPACSSPPAMTAGRWHMIQRGSSSAGCSSSGVVQDRVEHADDLALHLDAVRDQHAVGVGADESLGDRRLAGAGRAVEEDGAVATDGRAELVDERRRDHQVGERPRQLVTIEVQVRHLGADHALVEIERNGQRTEVAALVGALAGVVAAERRSTESRYVRPLMPSYSTRRRSRIEATMPSMTLTLQWRRSATRTIEGRPSAITVRRMMSSTSAMGRPDASTVVGARSSDGLRVGSACMNLCIGATSPNPENFVSAPTPVLFTEIGGYPPISGTELAAPCLASGAGSATLGPWLM